ncbi:SANT domain [Sesbania bispinosa]|nr:SANT domain [Sesbania bispinosa]
MVDAVRVNDLVNCIDEQADEQSLSPEFSDVYDVFGDPDIFPRVGEQYQVEIPSLISVSDYNSFQKNTHEAEGTASALHKFQVGLPIPIIWIKDEVENNKHDPLKKECKSIGVTNKIESSKLECIEETQNGGLDCEKWNPKLEAIDSTLVNGMKSEELENSNAQQETKIGMHEKHRDKGHRLVPGSASDTWNEIEEASFILGLYIFGKNLVQVKRFIGNKKMGDILSFYYGKFYKSDKYQRWSGCRKMRSRKCIFGQKIFTGPRQQELLSRLLPNVSEECQNKLIEVSKKFLEGKMLLEDYVLTLKASVGLKALVEGVGVGKGKEDLTGFTVDSMKSTQAHPVRPEIPVGKACSMLTPSEIISFLTGDFRLSKARTSDLFWEAVWPRLLARGWHSEQPGSYNYAVASKNPLVFLVPGVKKFSRKLVKGNHYFDSVSDVLGKVASDPELIELETTADNDCTGKEGNGWTKDTKLDRENSPDQPRHCYLKVKAPNRSTDGMKFTVVDTSLASEKMTKVRELRSLPFGVLKTSIFENDSDDENTLEEKSNESESVNTIFFDRGKNDIPKASKFNICKGVNGLENNPSKEELPRSNIGSNLSASSIDQKTNFLNNTVRKDGIKCQSLQRMVSDNKNDLVPVTKKRRRLTACSRVKKISNTANFFVVPRVKPEEISFCQDLDNSKCSKNETANFFVAARVKQEKTSHCAYSSNFSENVLSREIPPQENISLGGFPTQENKTLADPLSNPSSITNREAVPETSSSGTKDQHEKPVPRAMIDLNLPVSPEADADEPFVNEVTGIQQSNTSKESDELNVGTAFKPVDHFEHQPDIHARRQSTRNRPPTTKVLEAFAFGYLDRKEKRRNRDYLQDSSISRPSRRVCRKAAGPSSGGAGFEKEGRRDVVCNGNGSTSSNSDVIDTGFKCNEGT